MLRRINWLHRQQRSHLRRDLNHCLAWNWLSNSPASTGWLNRTVSRLPEFDVNSMTALSAVATGGAVDTSTNSLSADDGGRDGDEPTRLDKAP